MSCIIQEQWVKVANANGHLVDKRVGEIEIPVGDGFVADVRYSVRFGTKVEEITEVRGRRFSGSKWKDTHRLAVEGKLGAKMQELRTSLVKFIERERRAQQL